MRHYVPPPPGDLCEVENSFYLRGHSSRIAKLLAHYELYRQILDLPGAIVELGVYKGTSLMRFASYRGILENADARPIIGFDAFGAFPREAVSGEADQRFIAEFEAAGGPGIARADLGALIADKGFTNIELVEGNVFETLPAFLAAHPALRIALLHLDLDVYEPTAFALDQLLPHMVCGGVVVFDDYGLVEGATRAAEEACDRLRTRMTKLPHHMNPAYFIAP